MAKLYISYSILVNCKSDWIKLLACDYYLVCLNAKYCAMARAKGSCSNYILYYS